MKEQTIQKKITKFLEDKGAYVVKVISATKAGVPDILCCYKGIFIGIEVKTHTTKTNVSKLQEYNLDKIKTCLGLSMVAWELKQVEDFIKEIDNDKARNI